MKISVALCTRDGERFLSLQLESIAAGRRLPDEIVACDDRSHDGTVGILERFAARAAFPVRIIRNQHRLGITGNFEQAIRLCAGEVIALADQDDVWKPEKLDVIEERFARDAAMTCLFSDAGIIDDAGRVQPGTLWSALKFTARQQRDVHDGHAFAVLATRNVATGATMALRASLRERILPIPRVEGLLHDQWIGLIAASCGGLRACAEPLIDYRVHASQHIGTRWNGGGSMPAGQQFAVWARQSEAALARIEEDHSVPPDRLEPLRARIRHLRARATLPREVHRRIALVTRELLTLRYHRFSNHFWSAALDLIGRTRP